MMTENNVTDESISSASFENHFERNEPNNNNNLGPLDILAKTVLGEEIQSEPIPAGFVQTTEPLSKSGVTIQEGLEFCDAMGSMIEDLSKQPCQLISAQNNISPLKPDQLLMSLQEIILAEHNYNKPYSLINEKVGKSRRSTSNNNPNVTKKPRKIKEKHKEKAEKKPKAPKVVKEVIDKPPVINNNNATNKVIKIKKRTKNQSFELLKSPLATQSSPVKSNVAEIDEPLIYRQEEGVGETTGADANNNNNNNPLSLIPNNLHDDVEKAKFKPEILPPMSSISNNQTESQQSPESENTKEEIKTEPEFKDDEQFDALISKPADSKVDCKEEEEVEDAKSETDIKSDIIKSEESSASLISSEETTSGSSKMQEIQTQAQLTTPQSGRSQRVRKKPKRWTDDEVEVDFSGQLNILGADNPTVQEQTSAETNANLAPVMEETTPVVAKKTRRGNQSKLSESNGSYPVAMKEQPTPQNVLVNDEEESSLSDAEDQEEEEAEQDEAQDDDSSFSSDDDPEKLWCICRQPYDDRFMISCDSCEEWFHGKCVNVTKVQGRKMERLKQEWFCKTCIEGLKNGATREELKRQAEIKAAEIEAAEREQFVSKKAAQKLAKKKVKESPKKKVTKAATKKATAVKKEVQSPPVTHQPPVIAIKSVRRSSLEMKEEPKKPEPVSPIKEVVPVAAKKEEIYSSESDDDSIKSEDDCDEEVEVSNKAHNKSSEATTKATKAAAAKENQRKESIKELEDKRRLKKLIKASKKDFIEKQEKLQKIKLEQRNTSSDTAVDFAEPHDSAVNSTLTTPTTPNSINFVISPDDFSKVVTIKKSDKDVPKKKHKSQPIDRSVQDLFKAEPVLVRSLSTSSTLSPVAAAPVFQRKEFRRTSISSSSSSSHDQDIYCPAGCGKINYSPKSNFYNNSTNQEETSQSIYCNQSCIQLHVTEMIKFLRAAKRLKERANPHLPPKPLKGVVVNRITGKILSGKDALLEKDLLDFLIKNPSYEIYKPIGFSRPPKSLQLSSSSNSNHSHNSHNNNHHHHSNSKSSTPTTPTKSSFNSNNNHKSSSDSKKSSSKSSTNSSDSSKKHHEKSSSSSSSNDSSKKSHDKSSTSTSHGSPVKIERTSSTSEKPDDHNRRKFVRNALKDIFNTRYKEMSSSDKSRISVDDIPKLSLKIEDELFKLFKCINPKYNVKSRSLIFNLKDPKNSLYRKVLLGKIPPGRLVNMSAEELASSELARWRENEKKTMIELIKRDAVDQANQVIVKKTHKGEEIIQENHDLISDLPIADSQIETLISSTSTKDVQSASCSSTNETNLSHNSQETSVTNESIVNALMLDFNANANDSGGMSDLLDTTSQHKSHVFSNNCKICTKTLAEDVKNHEMSKDSLSSTTSALLSSTSSPPSTSATSSVSTFSSKSIVAVKSKSSKDDKNRSQPKRVRIEPESTNKFLEKVVKMSDTLLKSSVQLPALLASTSDSSNSGCASESSPLTPTTTTRDASNLEINVDTSKQESGANHSASSPAANTAVKSIWKGTIFMQDVAKFVADAYNLSGTIALDLSQDMSDHITVCGRITPEQVLDYVAKLKITKRTDIGVVKFLWSSREERIGYDAFFNYLNSRGRYGVVGNVGKNYKDFYILPLSRSSDIPKVLLPVDSSAIESKIHRPNLLLGILIRTKKLSTSQVLQPTNIPLTSVVSSSQQSTISSTTPTQSHLEQSYTPPPPEDVDDDDDGSYTPPQNPPSSSSKRYSEDALAFIHDSDSKIPKYDPEEPLVLRKSSATTSVSPSYINDLMEKVATSSNPVDMTQSVLTAISNSDNLNLKKRLLEQLTEKVEDQRRQLEKQKRETEEKIISSSVSVLPPGLPLSGGGHHLASPLTSPPPQSSSLANLASSSVSLDNVFNNIKNIQIPDNLKDILQTVQEKTAQIEAQQARLRSINTDFIASNSTSSADPRLRSKKPINLSSTEPTEPVASMSQDELLRKAQEQMAALAQMESHCDDSNTNCNNKTNNKGPVFVVGVPPNSSSGFRGHNSHSDSSPRSMNSPTSCTSSGSVPSMPKISFSWKKKK